jgi:methionyl-tRNA synthetase
MGENELHVITSAFPFVPAELNIAHFASTYVPADVCCRYFKIFGKNSIHVGATDFHSYFASNDGKTIDINLCYRYDEYYRDLFRLMKISYDRYITTEDELHTKIVNKFISNLNEQNQLLFKEAENCECDKCGSSLPISIFEDKYNKNKNKKQCPFCGSETYSIIIRKHCFLKLSDKNKEIEEFAEGCKQPDVQSFIKSICTTELKDWDFTRESKFGIPFILNNKQSLYLWFESLIAYYSLISDRTEEERKFYHFLGKNIIYYHGVIWPLMLKRGITGKNDIAVISARGFLDFDNTDKEIIDIKNIVKEIDADYIRFYLIYKVKDNTSDYNFKINELYSVISEVLCKKVINLNYRVFKCLAKISCDKLPKITIADFDFLSPYIDKIKQLIFDCNVNEALKVFIESIEFINKKMGDYDFRDIEKVENIRRLIVVSTWIFLMLKPILPDIASRISIYENWEPKEFDDYEKIEGKKLKSDIDKIIFEIK